MNKKESDLKNIRNNELEELIHHILTSPGEYVEDDDLRKLYSLLKKAKFITPACGGGILRISDTTGGLSIPAFTSIDEYSIKFEEKHIKPIIIDYVNILIYLEDESLEGLFVNPEGESFFISRDMIIDALDL